MANSENKQNIIHQIEEEATEDIHPLLKKIYENIKIIAFVIGGIILVAACYSGYQFYHQHRMQTAQNRLANIYAQDSKQKKIKGLKEFLVQAPEEMRQGILFELARDFMQENKFDQAMSYWEQLRSKTKDINIKTVAALGQAKSLRLQGNLQKALQVLETIAQKAPNPYHRNIYMEIATTAELSKDWPRALSAYKEIQSNQKLTNQKDNYIEYKISQLKQKVSTDNS